ncbi:MAG TPA: GAF and ANTAR domain-containing protein [Mycobacterium sp.]|nr:GAF and ANTAR domain-containing protein [Mycobacterium sp.]
MTQRPRQVVTIADESGLIRALIGFAHTLTAGYDINDVLYDLTGRITEVLGIAGTGVSLRQRDALRFVTADHESALALQQIQEQHQEGPCVEAFRTGDPVSVPQLAAQRKRWPAYAAKAADVGIVADAAIPMRDVAPIGVLDLYDSRIHEWSAAEFEIAGVFNDIATAYVLHASQLQREQRTVEQLGRALNSRIVIEQAKGMLTVESGISLDRAFRLMRKHANDHNVTLRAVAEAVVNLGLRFPPTSPPTGGRSMEQTCHDRQ